jgi:catechol 2,3-dioxygenase-like lactoylglutathione lyase family enzyme
MIDHVSVGVSDLERSARFYETALTPLGLSPLVTRPATVGFGKSYPEFWINLRAEMAQVAPDSGVHVCLRAKSAGEVDARRACARTIACAITRLSSSIPTATASRPSHFLRNDAERSR